MLFSSCGDSSAARNISASTFNNICKAGGVIQLFDVREPNELVAEGRFPVGVNIPSEKPVILCVVIFIS